MSLANFILCFYIGVFTGLRQDWFSMVLFFYLLVYTAHMYIGSMLHIKIDTCFERIQDNITKQSDSSKLEKLKTGRKLDLFMIVLNGVVLLFSILVRQRPLLLCIILASLAIANFTSKAVIFALRIKAYSKRIEELICRTTYKADSQQ